MKEIIQDLNHDLIFYCSQNPLRMSEESLEYLEYVTLTRETKPPYSCLASGQKSALFSMDTIVEFQNVTYLKGHD